MNSVESGSGVCFVGIVATLLIKPVFGFMSWLPLFGLGPACIGATGTISWVSLATVVHTPMAATVAIALVPSVAISDVIVDSLVVERARAESQGEAGSLQLLGCFICWKLDSLLWRVTARAFHARYFGLPPLSPDYLSCLVCRVTSVYALTCPQSKIN